MTLQSDTKDLHHACEQHPVGAAMSRGDVSEQVWTDWLGCLFVVHSALDYHLPVEMRRHEQLKMDLMVMANRGYQPRPNSAALRYATIGMRVDAATYVFTGAHLMGGAVMAQRIGGRLPTRHLHWYNRRAVLDLWRPYRSLEGVSQQARDAFAAILAMMDEIDA